MILNNHIRILLLVMPLLAASSLFSQINNPNIKRTWHWYFGDSCGVDFSNQTPVADLSGRMNSPTGHGPGSISDVNGNLQFYTNSQKVWNKSHQIMPNGTDLLGNRRCQGSLIVPKPGSNNIYYIFYIWLNPDSSTYKYAVIDMNLDNGLGDVTEKNITLLSPSKNGLWCTERQAATSHRNGIDYWITTTEYLTNKYYTFRITPNGVDTTPIISQLGIPDNYANGDLRFSPDGKRACIMYAALDGIGVLDFDNETGLFSNYIHILPGASYTPSGQFRAEFSPNSKLLYVLRQNYPIPPLNLSIMRTIMYDINGDSAQIADSEFDFQDSIYDVYYGSLQLGSDGKIYGIRQDTSFARVFNNPNEYGNNSNLNNFGLNLGEGKNSNGTFGQFVSSFFYDSTLATYGFNLMDSNNKDYIISANPNHGNFTITEKKEGLIRNYTITNILGKAVQSGTMETRKTTLVLDISSQPEGIYTIILETNEGLKIEKILVLD